MHDAAISAWSVKGWYDYIRPISAIRSMAERGQSTDENLANYDISGIALIDNYIELVEVGDPLAGPSNENVGKIKLYTWRGHDFINDPEVDEAGVGCPELLEQLAVEGEVLLARAHVLVRQRRVQPHLADVDLPEKLPRLKKCQFCNSEDNS